MDYRIAWYTLKDKLECIENYLIQKAQTDKKRDEDITKGKIIGLDMAQQFMFDMEADAGLYTIGSEAEVTENLRQSMESSLIRTDKESAREFLSKLSMYDEIGQLIKDYSDGEN